MRSAKRLERCAFMPLKRSAQFEAPSPALPPRGRGFDPRTACTILRTAARLILMIIAPLLWSIAGVVTRNLSPELQAQGRFEITFWRSLFAAIFVGGFLLLIRAARLRRRAAARRAGRAAVRLHVGDRCSSASCWR